jgi:hypothetical protein
MRSTSPAGSNAPALELFHDSAVVAELVDADPCRGESELSPKRWQSTWIREPVVQRNPGNGNGHPAGLRPTTNRARGVPRRGEQRAEKDQRRQPISADRLDSCSSHGLRLLPQLASGIGATSQIDADHEGWTRLAHGSEALLVDGGGIDGSTGYFIANAPDGSDNLHVIGPTAPPMPGKIGAIAIHAASNPLASPTDPRPARRVARRRRVGQAARQRHGTSAATSCVLPAAGDACSNLDSLISFYHILINPA